jgi:hypothetical protein
MACHAAPAERISGRLCPSSHPSPRTASSLERRWCWSEVGGSSKIEEPGTWSSQPIGKAFNMPANQLPPAQYTVTAPPAPDTAAHAKVKQMKQQLKDLVAARIAYYANPARAITGNDSLPADQ